MKTISTVGAGSTASPVPLTTISVDIEVDLRIWSAEIIKRVLLMLGNQIMDVGVDEELFPKTVIKLKFLSPGLNAEEIADFFHAKLISTKATVDHSKRSQEIRNYFVQTAVHVTTTVRNQIELAFEKSRKV